MKSIFEQMGGTYTKVGDYYIPNIELPTQKTYSIGKYGRLHARFIKENYPSAYSLMLMRGTWLDYLEEIDSTAKAEVERLVKHFAQTQGITEQLKADNPMRWVGLMNNAKGQAEEIIYSEIIYTRGNF